MRGACDRFAGDDEAEVGVIEMLARLADDDAVLADHLVGVRHVALITRPVRVAADVERRETAHVRVQLPDGDLTGVPHRARDRRRAQVLVDGPVEVEPVLGLEHCGERRLERLVERREEEWRVRGRAPIAGAVRPADRLLPDDLPIAHHRECGGRRALADHPLAEDPEDLAEVGRALRGERGRDRDRECQGNDGLAHLDPEEREPRFDNGPRVLVGGPAKETGACGKGRRWRRLPDRRTLFAPLAAA